MQKGRHLSTILKYNLLVHMQQIITPVYPSVEKSGFLDKRIKRDQQQELFDTRKDWRKKELGYFYEMLTAGIHGGKIGEEVELYTKWVAGFDDKVKLKNKVCAYPDVYRKEDDHFIESKGCEVGSRLKLSDGQMDLYRVMLSMNKDFSLSHAIYLHSLRNLGSFEGKVDDLHGQLSERTECSLVLPYGIVQKLYESEDKDLVYNYEGGESFQSGTEIRPQVLKHFFAGNGTDSAREVIKMLDLDPENYLIGRKMSHPHMEVEGHRVKEFPILYIGENESVDNLDDIPF